MQKNAEQPQTAGEMLRQAREAKFWSKRGAARHAGVSEGTWRNMEADRRGVEAGTIAKMARAVGLDPEELVAANRHAARLAYPVTAAKQACFGKPARVVIDITHLDPVRQGQAQGFVAALQVG
jgi:plasmid maintenance system antidote protein VapI